MKIRRAYHAILFRDSVIVVEGIVDHAILIIERLPVPDRQNFDEQQTAERGEMSTNEIQLSCEACQGAQYYQHQSTTKDELQPRATHRRHERLANNVHFLLGEACLLAVPAKKFRILTALTIKKKYNRYCITVEIIFLHKSTFCKNNHNTVIWNNLKIISYTCSFFISSEIIVTDAYFLISFYSGNKSESMWLYELFHAESDSLLVKGVQLVVDQLQFLGVRHLMLFLGVRLTRLLNTLAARHRDRFLLFSFNVQGWCGIALLSQSSRIRSRNELVAIEP